MKKHADIFAVSRMMMLSMLIMLGVGIGGPVYAASGLSPAEEEDLIFMREEEKLARDVYLSMFDLWEMPVFNMIAASEQRHMDAVKGLIERYGLVDPVVDDTVGVFTNQGLQDLYEGLIGQGQGSLIAALEVGVFIEETDINDLTAALAATTHLDIERVYSNLLAASYKHLRAFTNCCE